MLVHTDWPELGDLSHPAADAEMAFVTRLIDEIRSARAQMHVPVGLKIPMLALTMDDAARAAWDRNAALIQRLARIEGLSPADAAPKGAITIALPGATLALPLDGIIDVGEELGRLEKTLAKLEKEVAGLEVRLNNPNFVASAPEDVVDEARANLEARQDEAAKLRAARDRLREMA
jgi:valyl-tRNA synthetase